MQYKETAESIVDYLLQQLLNKNVKKPKPTWEFGAISVVEKLLRKEIPPEKIIYHITEEVQKNPQIRAGYFPPRPTLIFESIKPAEMQLILIDNTGNELDREKWGYFDGGEFIPPIPDNNKLFYYLQAEEEKRVTFGIKNNKFDEYFRNDGFLLDEYSFISGIFNEKNSKWKKI